MGAGGFTLVERPKVAGEEVTKRGTPPRFAKPRPLNREIKMLIIRAFQAIGGAATSAASHRRKKI